MPLLLLTPLCPLHIVLLPTPNTGNDLILTLFTSHAHTNTVAPSVPSHEEYGHANVSISLYLMHRKQTCIEFHLIVKSKLFSWCSLGLPWRKPDKNPWKQKQAEIPPVHSDDAVRYWSKSTVGYCHLSFEDKYCKKVLYNMKRTSQEGSSQFS